MNVISEPNEEGRIFFHCPGCKSAHGPWVRVDVHGLPVRDKGPNWEWNGSRDKPTFTPSILTTWGRGAGRRPHVCHSYITDGRIQYLSDCTHALAGQTVDLPEWNY